jgi:hypothetical protein
MNGTKTAPDPWMYAEEVCKVLKVKLRQVQQRAAQGYIETHQLPRKPTERQGRTLYRRADVEALKAGKPNMHAVEVEMPAKTQALPARAETKALARRPPLSPSIAELSGIGGVLTLREFLQETRPREPKAWLTLDEAAAYSGLPRILLEVEIWHNRIVTLGRGPKTWRIQRASLDAFGRGHKLKA